MGELVGGARSVKKRFMDLIEDAIEVDPFFGSVSGEWQDLPINFVQHLPLVTVRLGPSTVSSEFYGQILLSDNLRVWEGQYDEWEFTLYCFASACRVIGEDTNRYVHEMVDEIDRYIRDNRGGLSENYAIEDVNELSGRESNVEGLPRNVRRMIVEGRLWVRRYKDKRYIDQFPYYLPAELG